jgi:hypothetical protein
MEIALIKRFWLLFGGALALALPTYCAERHARMYERSLFDKMVANSDDDGAESTLVSMRFAGVHFHRSLFSIAAQLRPGDDRLLALFNTDARSCFSFYAYTESQRQEELRQQVNQLGEDEQQGEGVNQPRAQKQGQKADQLREREQQWQEVNQPRPAWIHDQAAAETWRTKERVGWTGRYMFWRRVYYDDGGVEKQLAGATFSSRLDDDTVVPFERGPWEQQNEAPESSEVPRVADVAVSLPVAACATLAAYVTPMLMGCACSSLLAHSVSPLLVLSNQKAWLRGAAGGALIAAFVHCTAIVAFSWPWHYFCGAPISWYRNQDVASFASNEFKRAGNEFMQDGGGIAQTLIAGIALGVVAIAWARRTKRPLGPSPFARSRNIGRSSK